MKNHRTLKSVNTGSPALCARTSVNHHSPKDTSNETQISKNESVKILKETTPGLQSATILYNEITHSINEVDTNIRGNTSLQLRNCTQQSWNSDLAFEELLADKEELDADARENDTDGRGIPIVHFGDRHVQSKKSHLTLTNLQLTLTKFTASTAKQSPFLERSSGNITTPLKQTIVNNG